MTPAINAIKKAKIFYAIHEYMHEKSLTSYGAEAAEKIGLAKEKVFKTLVVQLDGKALAVGIIPFSSMLSMKHIAQAAGVKKAVMAEASDVERSTGYILGGISPLGQKKRLKTFIDSSAQEHQTIFVSAGRRGLEVELYPQDLLRLTNGSFVHISQE